MNSSRIADAPMRSFGMTMVKGVCGGALLALALAGAADARAAKAASAGTIDPVRLVGPATLPGDPPTVRISYPAGRGKRPIILFSHGNRLSRGDYGPIVTAWTAAGFIVVQPDHPDAATGVEAVNQPLDTWRRRIADIGHVLDGMDMIDSRLRPLGLRIDRARIAVAGHSFGGHTAAALMGMRVRDPATAMLTSFGDRRVTAALLLAPPGGIDGMAPSWRSRAPYLDTDWRAMRGPVLVLNGGRDAGGMSAIGAGWHDAAYRGSSASGICLLVVPEGDHYLGGISRRAGAPAMPPAPADTAMLDDVRRLTTLYWRAVLSPAAPAGWTVPLKAEARRAGLSAQCHAGR